MSTPDDNASAHADELLVLRCQLGERQAFDGLIDRWAAPLHRHVLRVTGEADVADELTQDIWLRVLQGIARLREPARFRPWLFGTAHRVLMDRFRRQYAAPLDAETDLDTIADPEPGASPERMAADQDVERNLHRLPVLEREVLTLFYLDELTIPEVALALDVPPGTVKSRLFRARKQLRSALVNEESTP